MKIRSITYFCNPKFPLEEKALRKAGTFLAEAKSAYEAAGYEVQTVRLATIPFPKLLGEENIDKLPALTGQLADIAKQLNIGYFSLGPALPEMPRSYEVIPDAIFVSKDAFLGGVMDEIDRLAYRPGIILSPRTRYFWKVRVWGETESAESDPAWFETAKMDEPWQGQWITPDFENNQTHPVLLKTFDLPTSATFARLYICGLGLYHCKLNGEKVGDEQLTPYCNAYDRWLQYQTYDITAQLQRGENQLRVMLGNGWYKGRYGLQFDGDSPQTYGDAFALIAELRICLANGEELVLGTDDSWQAVPAPVAGDDCRRLVASRQHGFEATIAGQRAVSFVSGVTGPQGETCLPSTSSSGCMSSSWGTGSAATSS